MPRFYLRKLRAELGAHEANGGAAADGDVALLERDLPASEPSPEIPVEAASVSPDEPPRSEQAISAEAQVETPPMARPRRTRARKKPAEAIAVEAVMTEAVADVADVTAGTQLPESAAAGSTEAPEVAEEDTGGEARTPEQIAVDAIMTEDAAEAAAVVAAPGRAEGARAELTVETPEGTAASSQAPAGMA